jgi:hypothetical protein
MSVDHPQHELALQQGRDEGAQAGRLAGFEEGRKLGQTKGVDYGMEVGFARGLLRAVQRLHGKMDDEHIHDSCASSDIATTTTTAVSSGSTSPIKELNGKSNDVGSLIPIYHNNPSSTIIGNVRIQKSVDELAAVIGHFPNTVEELLTVLKITAGPESENENDINQHQDMSDAIATGSQTPSSEPFSSSLNSVSSSANFDLREQLQRIRARTKVLTAKLGIPHHSVSSVLQEYGDGVSSSILNPSLKSSTTSITNRDAENVPTLGRKNMKAGTPSSLRTAEW